MPEPRKAPRPASVSRAREGASTRGASGGLMMAAAEHDRRRVDPRVALAVLVLLNVAVFASGAKAIELAAVAGDAALMLWCRRGRLACAWLGAYAALSLIALACILGGPFFMPMGSCLVMLARLFPTAMFAAALISTTYLGELACALQSFGLSGRMTVAVCVGMTAEYGQGLVNWVYSPAFPICGCVTALCAALGSWLGLRIFQKHFAKIAA